MVVKGWGRGSLAHGEGEGLTYLKDMQQLRGRCFLAEESTSAPTQGEAGTHRGNCGAVEEGDRTGGVAQSMEVSCTTVEILTTVHKESESNSHILRRVTTFCL